MTKKTPFLLSLSLAAGIGLLACGGAGSSDNTSNASNAGGNTNKAASSNTASSNTSTTASTGDKIGVPECDDYIAKYEACVNSKVPETMRATVKASMETARKQWKDLAATPQGKAGLAQACKAATDAAKQAMSSYGCSW